MINEKQPAQRNIYTKRQRNFVNRICLFRFSLSIKMNDRRHLRKHMELWVGKKEERYL